MSQDGVLFLPTLPDIAGKHGTTFRVMDFSYGGAVNCAELTATHVTMGLGSRGMPIGFQVAAGPYQDRLTLAVAEELEREFGGWVPPSGVSINSLSYKDLNANKQN